MTSQERLALATTLLDEAHKVTARLSTSHVQYPAELVNLAQAAYDSGFTGGVTLTFLRVQQLLARYECEIDKLMTVQDALRTLSQLITKLPRTPQP